MKASLQMTCWFLLSFQSVFSQHPKKEFELPDRELIPEGIAYSTSERVFFIGSIAKKKIIKADMRGKVSDFISAGQDSVGEVLGIKVDDARNWVVSVGNHTVSEKKSFVHIYNFSGSLLKKISHRAGDEKSLFNDLTILSNGEIFITDSDGGSLYRIDRQQKELSIFLQSDQLRYANGITQSPDHKKLIVSTGVGFVMIDPVTKEINPLPFNGYFILGIDGLYTYQNSLIGIQNVTYPVSIIQYSLSNDFKKIESGRLLTSDVKWFNIPTTGAIVKDKFYFIANSQLDKYEKGALVDAPSLTRTIIASVKLR